jgi:hypothetical protein
VTDVASLGSIKLTDKVARPFLHVASTSPVGPTKRLAIPLPRLISTGTEKLSQ